MNEQFDNYSFLIKQAPASIYKDRLVFIVNGSTFGQGFTYPFKPSGFYYSDGSKWIYKGATNNTGTVTSVDITTNAPAITITGNPITTAGTIDLNFNGANTDYIDGTGALQPFPTSLGTVTSVDLTMPSAFAVSGNPITTAGTLAVTGAGTTSQYIRGDGTLANFPTSTGGASVSYYLNGGTNQGIFVGNTYYEMNKTAVIGSPANFSIAANGYIAQFITDANDPSQLNIPAGNWNFEMYFQASSGGGSPTFYVELYKWDGAAFTLIASSSTNPEGITNGTTVDLYTTALAVPATTLAITDRLAVRVYVNNSGRTITLHTEDNNLCQVITTFTTGLTALNGLTAQVQTFATGTSGTDFGIVSSGSTHTFNLPTASALNRGALSSADWTTFNNKQNAITPAALTKVDDTNVTLTLGGTPATALLQATSLTLGWSGQLSVARGGTGGNLYAGWDLISTATASSSSEIDFTGLNSTYLRYVIILTDLIMSTNSVNLLVRFGTGPSFTIDTSNNYAWLNAFMQGTPSIGSVQASFTGTSIRVNSNAITNVSTKPVNGEMVIYNPSTSTTWKGFDSRINFFESSFICQNWATSTYKSNTAITAVRIFPSAGTLLSGTIKLYGIR